MGRSDHAPDTFKDDSARLLPAALRAFPSPADITAPLSSPILSHTLNAARPFPTIYTPYDGSLATASAISTMPDEITRHSITTPQLDADVHTNMNLLVSGALAPLPTSTPRPQLSSKDGPGLRLPSFEQLGIAAPRPDRLANTESYFPFQHHSGLVPSVGSLRDGADIRKTVSDSELARGNGRAVQSPIYHYANPLTPPTDADPITGNMECAVQTVGMHSPRTHLEPSGAPSSHGATTITFASQGPAFPVEEQSSNGGEHGGSNGSWIDGAVDVILGNLTASRRRESLRILSHALPSTSTPGHVFGDVIAAVHSLAPVTPDTPTTWINVFHAIPGRFNLKDLPTSPPATPGPPIGGEDYFTQKTFDSAVSISDYQEDLSALPRSPRPVVPPSSIDLSIVERYIPPSTSNEFAEMFDPNGSSILVDRLVELSPKNGSLLFVYPTKQGGETFMREYLGPILDPLLRTMAVVHGFGADVCSLIGSMNAVNQLLEHETLHRRISALCARLTQQDTAAQRFHGRRPSFAVSYSARQSVKLSRGVWAREWWTKQEKTRIKQVLAYQSREAESRRDPEARRKSTEFSSQGPSSTALLQSLLSQVCGSERQEKDTPGSGIEVSVFVIKRSM